MFAIINRLIAYLFDNENDCNNYILNMFKEQKSFKNMSV